VKGGNDAISPAIASGNPEVLALLLDRVKTLGLKDSVSQTSYLHVAAFYNEPSMIPLLLEKGLSINAVTASNITPLYIAVTSGGLEATLKLLELWSRP
jgi:ankyrin repeat protein